MAELDICAVELDGIILICDLREGHRGDHATLITWEQEGPIYLHNHEDCPPECLHCQLTRLYTRALIERIDAERLRKHAFGLGVADGLPNE